MDETISEANQTIPEESRHETFWSWTDLLLFAGLGVPVFLAGFFAASALVVPLTDNKALRLMIPQFVGQAAMLIRWCTCSDGSMSAR
jgi:hypothetical protein